MKKKQVIYILIVGFIILVIISAANNWQEIKKGFTEGLNATQKK
jgi:hypothetical protein